MEIKIPRKPAVSAETKKVGSSSQKSLKKANGKDPAPSSSREWHQDGVLVPGVKLVAGYDVKGRGQSHVVNASNSSAKSSKGAKRKRGGESDSDESMGGFGPDIQTLAKDIKHLQKLFPG